MKTNRLQVEYDYDFIVFGLISSSKAYKLAWVLNKVLKIHFVKSQDLHFDFIKEGEIYITNYIHRTEYWCLRLLRNKSCEYQNTTKPYLLPELKNYDYFLHLSGEVSLLEPLELNEKIRHISMVEYVTKIDVENLKSRENLIF